MDAVIIRTNRESAGPDRFVLPTIFPPLRVAETCIAKTTVHSSKFSSDSSSFGVLHCKCRIYFVGLNSQSVSDESE